MRPISALPAPVLRPRSLLSQPRRHTPLSTSNAPKRFQCRRTFLAAASHAANKIQVYTSRSNDPYLNLSIEHALFQKTPPESTVLFLYVNGPSVVIGRNQNVWAEVDIPLLERLYSSEEKHSVVEVAESVDLPSIQLVRRRSGGGTVFHDEGNVNYCVICPPEKFHRRTHAEMVSKALRNLGVSSARVNSRHDIVVRSPEHQTGEKREPEQDDAKISGSAFKISRLRAMHHGTCLLSSPYISHISSVLRSPAAPYILGRGVASVRSRVANVGVGREEFEGAVLEAFAGIYGSCDLRGVLGEGDAQDVLGGVEELRSRDWIYGQTPRFTFSSYPTEEDPRPRPGLDIDAKIHFEARHGIIESLTIDGHTYGDSLNLNMYNHHTWTERLGAAGVDARELESVGSVLERLLGRGIIGS